MHPKSWRSQCVDLISADLTWIHGSEKIHAPGALQYSSNVRPRTTTKTSSRFKAKRSKQFGRWPVNKVNDSAEVWALIFIFGLRRRRNAGADRGLRGGRLSLEPAHPGILNNWCGCARGIARTCSAGILEARQLGCRDLPSLKCGFRGKPDRPADSMMRTMMMTRSTRHSLTRRIRQRNEHLSTGLTFTQP